MEGVNDKFFTLYKAFWWLVYNLMGIGFCAVWVFINVNFLGADVAFDFGSTGFSERGKR